MSHVRSVVSGLAASSSLLVLAALVVTLAPAGALAQARVGGHVGLAVPLVTIPSEGDTTDVGDQFTLVAPIGVTVKLSDRVAIDLETQVANPVDPSGTTALVVAPGVVYNFGPFAAGLRVASEIGADSNVGVIPLVNKGLFPVGAATWFVEAAFPTFVHATPPDVTFTAVIHTGFGF
jgi:hypothetical protein